jgi:hypothetical protein
VELCYSGFTAFTGYTMKTHPPIDVVAVREKFLYDPDTGLVTRRVAATGSRGAVGAVVGTPSGLYKTLLVQLGAKKVSLLRVAYVLMTGEDIGPQDTLRVIDGDPSNLRWSNIEHVASAGYLARVLRTHAGRGYTYPDGVPDRVTKDVRYVCPTHGERTQPLRFHLYHGCVACRDDSAGGERKSTAAWLADFAAVHPAGRYAYPPVIDGALSVIEVVCAEHGVFAQQVSVHARGSGCPACGNMRKGYRASTVTVAADGGSLRPGWSGFDGRVFLTPAEQDVYRRRAPVRFHHAEHPALCGVCGTPGSSPRQWAHKIPFTPGVQTYGFTPDYLDRPDNLVSACRVGCNKAVEWNDAEILAHIAALPTSDS